MCVCVCVECVIPPLYIYWGAGGAAPPNNLITNKMNVSVFGQILLDNPIHMTELSVNNSGGSSFYNFSSVQ